MVRRLVFVAASFVILAACDVFADSSPPTPDPLAWSAWPQPSGFNSVVMTSVSAADPSGVEYLFECVSGNGHDSVWQDGPVYSDTGLDPNTEYTYRVKARDKSSNQNETAWSQQGSATTDAIGIVLQDGGADGIVSIETENYNRSLPQGGHLWSLVTGLLDFSGVGAMQALPNIGTLNNTGFETISPRLDFDIHFAQTGIHYVWLRGYGQTDFDDSCHAGIDGIGLTSSDRIDVPTDVLTWTNTTMDAADATIDISRTGLHTLNIWMREDGFIVDKIVLTTNAGFTPTWYGPPESPRSGFSDNSPPLPNPAEWDVESFPTGDGSISMTATAAYDTSGVEYYFECSNGGGHDSGWQGETAYEDTGLVANTNYTYRVKVRDLSTAKNETAWSISASAKTNTEQNDAPVVDAGLQQVIASPDEDVTLDGTVADDGLPDPPAAFTVYWEKVSGPGQVTFDDSNAVDTVATFSDFGIYVLCLNANDGELAGSDEVTIKIGTGEVVPLYGKFEAVLDVNTVAQNFQLPYDDNPPAGIAPQIGVSVDVLFTPDNWTTVYSQPAFYYQHFNHEVKSGKDWIYPTDTASWIVRFSPNSTGTWQYKILTSDSAGVIESSVDIFHVYNSEKKGFIQVSPDDQRYFAYENGDLFLGLGHNLRYYEVNWDDPVVANEPLFQELNSKGMQLFRTWLSHWGIYTSCWDNWQSPMAIYHGMDPPFQQLEADYSYQEHEISVRLGYYDTTPGNEWPASPGVFLGFGKRSPAVKQNTLYTIQVRYFIPNTISGPRIAGHPYGLVVKTGGWLGSYNDPSTFADPGTGTPVSSHVHSATGDWSILEGTLTTGSSDFLPYLYLVLENVQNDPNSYAYIDEVMIREDLGGGQYGPNILTDSKMCSHMYMDQKKSYAFDKTLELAEEYDIFFKLVLLEKSDWIFNRIDYDGTFVPENPSVNYFYGNWGNMTKVRWLQQAWWRYCQARWGYSQNIHSWELLNEGDPWNGLHYVLAEKLGQLMHQFTHNKHLVTTSCWGDFPKDLFWANATYPNVDYADYHRYSRDAIDLAADTEYYSMLHGAYRPEGAGKPIIRGETGFDTHVNNDDEGIWMHNFIWGGINPGGMYEQYWAQHGEFEEPPNDPRDHCLAFRHFMQDIPLTNGYYQNANAVVSNQSIRVWGQKDLLNGNCHLWIQNTQHTWSNIVNDVTILPESATVEIAGFEPDRAYTLQWWDTYEPNEANQLINANPVYAQADGTILLSVVDLTTDVAIKISRILCDVTKDGKTDFQDYSSLAKRWFWAGYPGVITEDILKDGQVDILDVAQIAEHWLE